MAYCSIATMSNVKGRARYITDPERQEEILAKSPALDWKPYVDYEREHRQSRDKNNEARELIIALPNEWAEKSAKELSGMADRLATKAIEKKSDYQWAVHWNEGRTNLHMHVLFSERTNTSETEYYKRDVYHTADGKVARLKKDRAIDKHSNERPPVHKKGEVMREGLSVKDKRYTKTAWLAETKRRVDSELTAMGYPQRVRQPGEQKQHHQGKGPAAERIRRANERTQTANLFLRDGRERIGEYIKGGPETLIGPVAMYRQGGPSAKRRVINDYIQKRREEGSDAQFSDDVDMADLTVKFDRAMETLEKDFGELLAATG